MDGGRAWCVCVCVFSSLLLSSWARYFSQPLRRTRSPSRSRNSSNAGPELSLLYMSSSELCPARQYITPTFRWKFSCIGRQSLDCYMCIFIASFHLSCQDFLSIHSFLIFWHLTLHFYWKKFILSNDVSSEVELAVPKLWPTGQKKTPIVLLSSNGSQVHVPSWYQIGPNQTL